MQLFQRKSSGQSIVVMALFAATLFIFVGLGIDGGMLYLERRHLQNISDAACLAAATELSLDGTADAARQSANEYINKNIDQNARIAFQMPTTINFVNTTGSDYLAQEGAGTSLTRGIEVDGSSVRVALKFPAFTYFMRLAGIDTYTVMARSHCGAGQGGGLLPIAVNRFPGYIERRGSEDRVYGPDIGVTLPQTYDQGSRTYPLIVRDILQKEATNTGVVNRGVTAVTGAACNSGIRNWTDWNDLGNAATRTGPYADSCDPASLKDPYAPGYEIEMVGQDALPNISANGSSFVGAILFDVRQLSEGDTLYYNGTSGATSINQWKDKYVEYVKNGYKGPEIELGQQIGVLSGLSAGQFVDPIDDIYDPGDVVTTLIYNGVLYRNPDFKMSIICVSGSFGCNPGGSAPIRVDRESPGSSNGFDTTSCKFGSQYFIADPNDFDSRFIDTSAGPLAPAKYNLRIFPDPTNPPDTSVPMFLTARISGVNVGSDGEPGGAKNLAGVKFRWTYPGPSGGTITTDWQNGSDPVPVNMPTTASGVTVLLEVIQSEKETISTCTTTAGVTYTNIEIPKREAGAQTIQVTARSRTETSLHSVYGALGMRANTSSPFFASGDYFLTFDSDPNGKIEQVRPRTSVTANFSLVDANTSAAARMRDMCPTSDSTCYNFIWYEVDESTGRWNPVAQPSGTTVRIVSTNPGDKPALEVTVDPSATPLAAAGDYAIDMQVAGLSSNRRVHSNRYHIKIEDEGNPSVDEWVVALCYADFEITYIDSNQVRGKAVSGCKDNTAALRGLTSRLLPW
jgi:hypothetical protein